MTDSEAPASNRFGASATALMQLVDLLRRDVIAASAFYMATTRRCRSLTPAQASWEKLNAFDPEANFRDVIARIADHKASKPDELLP